MRLIKLAFAPVFAVLFCVLAATSASAVTPLFLNQGGKPLLLFSGENLAGTKATLRATGGEVTCEKVFVDGFTLTKSTLAHRVLMDFNGKCEQNSFGNFTTCTEPIDAKPLLAELGLILGNKTAGILLEPSDGTKELTTIKCGTDTTTISGSVIGVIPEVNKKLVNQYSKQLSEVELVFESENKSGERQNVTSIELLGLNMTNVELNTVGFLAGEASLEYAVILKPDGTFEICRNAFQGC